MEPKTMSSGFFKSFTSSFRTPNNDRHKIESSSVTDDPRNQQLFDELKNASTSVRSKAADAIADCLYEFNPQGIPDIWYCAKDLISPNQTQQSRKAGLKILSRCASSPSDDLSSKYVYFTDALVNCHSTKSKLDPEFQEFLQIVQLLTDNGTFIQHHQESFKQPLLEFFISTLTSSDVARSSSVLEFLNLIIESIRSGIFDLDDSQVIPIYVAGLLELVIKLCLKTSDRMILEHCIKVIDAIVIYQTIPSEMLYETLEILSGAAILDLHYLDLATEVVMNLINKIQSSLVISTLIDIIRCQNVKINKNINAATGAISLIGHLFPNFAYQFNTTRLIDALRDSLGWNKPQLFLAVLHFINETLLSDLTLGQIDASSWDTSDSSILNLLTFIGTKASRDEEIELLKQIFLRLQKLGETTRYPGELKTLIAFFIENSKFIPTKGAIEVLRYYTIHDLCSPLSENWKSNITTLLNTFFYDDSKDIAVRLACVRLLIDVFDSSVNQELPGKAFESYEFIIAALEAENNTILMDELLKHFRRISVELPLELYRTMLDQYIGPRMVSHPKKGRSSSLGSAFGNLSMADKAAFFNDKTATAVVKSLVTIFAKAAILNGRKAQITYDLLINIAKEALQTKNVEILLITSRLFVRIRASSTKRVYLTTPTDMDGLAAAFFRNLNLRNTNDSSVHVSIDEKWVYPEEIDYIPRETLDIPANDLTIMEYDSKELRPEAAIDIQAWLLIVIQILETAPHWEVYSFTYAHFCPQLSNLRLYECCGDGIRRFRSLVCDQLTLKLPSALCIPENMSKQDLQVAIVRNFTPLTSYHVLFSKQDEDQIINALLSGLSSWEKTAIPCVHILTLCCYELPMSIKKFLSVILTKLQTRISSAFASAHILEFLLALSYIPTLTSNFTIDEFKRAFGITFKLIQHAHDVAETKDNQHEGMLAHGEELEADLLPSTENMEMTPVISMYLLSLSYEVIANWFLNMRLSDRRQLSSFIIRNLVLSQSNHGTAINSQNMAFIDLITRFTYSDLELNFAQPKFQRFSPDEPVLSSNWVYGNSIIGIDTHAKNGESIVSIRRASGTTVFRVTPDESMIPYYTNQLHSKTHEDDLFSSNYLLLQLVVHPGPSQSAKPIPIPSDAAFARSLANFDRIPVVEFHKVGLLYIGPNQTTEHQILSNDKGSAEYQNFLFNVGRTITLKGCKSFYVGGLDTENDADGVIAYGWNDKILQLIYHTTTLMPSHADDVNLSSKKRHIGNDYVNIFFDESGQPFDFNIIKSQFNFLNIVIQRHSISFGPQEHHEAEDTVKKYKVKVHRRSGVPGLFATCHFKIVSEKNLPTFVRTLALVANQFAQVWHSNGAYASNWSHRMRQLSMIREKALAAHGSTESDDKSSVQGSLDSTNKYEFTEEEDNEILKNLEFTSFTK